MSRSVKNFLDLREVPSLDCYLTFNLHLGVLELLLPCVKHLDALFNDNYGVVRLFLENFRKLDLVTDFLADFIGYGLQDVFELLLILVNVT